MNSAPTPCPVCRSRAASPLAEGHDFEYGSLPGPFYVWRCADCGHGFLDPVPSREQLPAIYPPTYYTVNPESPIHFDGFIYETKLRRDVDRILSLAGNRQLRRVVDLGCGDAERLCRLAERLPETSECIGVDFQPDHERLPELARRDVRIIEADIEGGLDALEDDSCDLVILCQLIEHLYDPAAALQTVAKKLATGGSVVVETPNLGGLDFRWLGNHWGGYHFPRHFHFFTPDTLSRTAEGAGLRVTNRGFIPSGFGIVGLRNRLGLSSIRRGHHFGEFLHMRNLFVVAAASVFDLLWIALGGQTSNQYLVAEKP